ncbi:hypothetical protein FIU87_04650 [Bacillus sp. THAF10]|nr:hypothetical protein FIU87_04650 [Bacillus sp. THAF10]
MNSSNAASRNEQNASGNIVPRSYHVHSVQLPFSGSCTFYNETKFGTQYRGYLLYSGEFSGKHYYEGIIFKAGIKYPTPLGEQILN